MPPKYITLENYTELVENVKAFQAATESFRSNMNQFFLIIRGIFCFSSRNRSKPSETKIVSTKCPAFYLAGKQGELSPTQIYFNMSTVNVSWSEYVQLQKQVKESHDTLDYVKSNVDQFFLITMGMICYLMQGGFAFLEAGAVRSKNSTNILIKNLMDSFVAGVAYWTIGFPLAYGEGNSFIGYSYWASTGLPEDNFAYFFFQYVFAATAATIVSGAMAERCEFMAYFVYSFFITAFVYPVVTHWAWTADGWLATGAVYGEGNDTFTVAYQDFAGSGVLHVLSGVAAFSGAFVLGPRIGRFHPEQKTPVDLRGHSIPFAALGGFILLFGFLSFNGGSNVTIVADGAGAVVSLAIVNTIVAGSVSAFFTLLITKTGYFGTHRWSLLSTLNGALTGMVSVCAGCNVIYPWGAAVLGFIASIAYKFVSSSLLRMKVDDPLDAVAVHFGGGIVGIIGVAFLKRNDGIFFVWDVRSGLGLAWQVAGVVTIIVWTAFWCFLLFGVLRLAGILRVPEEIERRGLDIPKHGEPAYPMEAYGHGWTEQIMKVLDDGTLSKIQQGLNLPEESPKLQDMSNGKKGDTSYGAAAPPQYQKIPQPQYHGTSGPDMHLSTAM